MLPLLLIASGFGQSGALRPQPGPWESHAANGWLRIPTRLPHSDSLSQSTRSARDEYFDEVLAPLIGRVPLSAESAKSIHITGDTFGERPEITSFAGRSILIGTIANYQSVLTPSRGSIYSEIHVAVSDVMESAAKIVPGSTITICYQGGTVELPTGEVISLNTDPLQYFIQPAKTYLLVLEYHQKGDFFTLRQDWEYANGVFMPNSADAMGRVRKNASAIVGLTKEQVTAYLATQH